MTEERGELGVSAEVVSPEVSAGVASMETVAVPEAESEPQESGESSAGERYTQMLAQVQAAAANDDDVDQDAESVRALEEAEKMVHMLVEMAQVKGVAHAVRVAKRMNDLYVLDTMHDELADKLYEGLLAKGLITKE